ncbi:MAG: hypothetical protein SOV41_02450 [Oscillospiraceae bacterium]|nr:hypothetical protein [Clostridiales bacterium]MDD7487202.1 hypothetical protein [Clostridiales bacterium]MDY2690442.1 hypothetical protein [Oscillospiraceae bacterium]
MINVELSSIWSCVSLPQLLACEKDLFDAHLHLRSNQPGAPEFLGWLGQPDAVTAKTIHAIRKACETISGQCDTLVVAGSGEGYLAAKAGVEMLGGRYRNLLDSRMRIVFTGDSLASSDWIALCRLLEGHEFCLLLLSREGAELEMCTASRALRWLMERRYGQGAKQRVYVSALPESPLAVMAKEEGFTYLPMAQCLAGGVSALNAGTLLVLAAAGIDPLGVLEGAAEGFSQYDLRAFENPVWMYAGARYALTQKGRSTEFLGCFTPDFGAFGAWWQQYFLRHTCREGAGAMPVYLPLPSALDAMDTVAQGKDQRVFETLLQVPERCFQKVNIEMDWKDYDGLGFLAGKTLLDAQEGSFQAVLQAHTDLDVPVIQVSMQTLDAAGVGELFYFFELAGAISACACGVDPFDGACAGASRALAKQLLGG